MEDNIISLPLYDIEFLKILHQRQSLAILVSEVGTIVKFSDVTFKDFLNMLTSLSEIFPEWELTYFTQDDLIVIDDLIIYNDRIDVIHQDYGKVYTIYDCFSRFRLAMNSSNLVYMIPKATFLRTTIDFKEWQNGAFFHPHVAISDHYSEQSFYFRKFCFGTSYFASELMELETRTKPKSDYLSLFLEWVNCLSTECGSGVYRESNSNVLQTAGRQNYAYSMSTVTKIAETTLLKAVKEGKISYTSDLEPSSELDKYYLKITLNKDSLLNFIKTELSDQVKTLCCTTLFPDDTSNEIAYVVVDKTNCAYLNYDTANTTVENIAPYIFKGVEIPFRILNIPENNFREFTESNIIIHPSVYECINYTISDELTQQLMYHE